eukprot:gene10271-2690_t
MSIKRLFQPYKSIVIGNEHPIVANLLNEHLNSFHCKELLFVTNEKSEINRNEKKFKKLELKDIRNINLKNYNSIFFFDQMEVDEDFDEEVFFKRMEDIDVLFQNFEGVQLKHVNFYSILSETKNVFYKYNQSLENLIKLLKAERTTIFRRNIPDKVEKILRKTLRHHLTEINSLDLAMIMKFNSEFERKGMEIFEDEDIIEMINIKNQLK